MRRDPIDHPLLAGFGCPPLPVVVALIEGVDVLIGLRPGHERVHHAVDPEPTIRILLVVDRHRHAGVETDVAVLHPAHGGVHEHRAVIRVDPRDRDVRRPVRPDHGEVREVLPGQQLEVVVVQGLHDHSSPSVVSFSPFDAAGGAITWIPSSRSCPASTGAGAPVSGSAPDCALGNAVTSRIASFPAISITIRSIPIAIPPWGGAPKRNARSRCPNFSSISSSESSSTSKTRCWSSGWWIRMLPPPTSKPFRTRS